MNKGLSIILTCTVITNIGLRDLGKMIYSSKSVACFDAKLTKSILKISKITKHEIAPKYLESGCSDRARLVCFLFSSELFFCRTCTAADGGGGGDKF